MKYTGCPINNDTSSNREFYTLKYYDLIKLTSVRKLVLKMMGGRQNFVFNIFKINSSKFLEATNLNLVATLARYTFFAQSR